MGKIIKIYCEGKRGSHDYDILEKVIDGLNNILIEPIGGKRGAKSAIQVFEKLAVTSDFKLFFRDRDFDKPVPDQEGLIIDSYVYFSYKPTIENYLLDINTFIEFALDDYGNEENIKRRFINAAITIKYHQAVRHTLGALREPTDFGTNICESSGILPEDLSRDFCRNQGIITMQNGKSKADRWTIEQFDEKLTFFEDKFDDRFFQNMEFINWFHGKDLAKAISQEFEGISLRGLYSYTKTNFDYLKHADLAQLRAIIEEQM